MKCIGKAAVMVVVAGCLSAAPRAMSASPLQATSTATKSGGRGRAGGTPGKSSSAKAVSVASKSIAGDVSSISASSITIKTDRGERTFGVDLNTAVQATNDRGNKTASTHASGVDAIKAGDRVVVSYQSAAASTRASKIRVVSKAKSQSK